ncbi:MAG: NADH dehydrogenase [Parcubacteria group bacterium Gr01-1014_29]|nr:MAG: NADH dehydrogenase [Parcubacteria group bacterium Gr01-1014_29]
MYDVTIIGGGPAAAGAAVYVARKKLKTLLIAGEFGGQSIVSADVQNWIGTKSLSGFDLAKNLEEHIRNYPEEVEIKAPELATKISKKGSGFLVETDKGGAYDTKTVIITSGARRRKLGIPGEEEFNGKGVAYCSTCDAPLFGGKDVAVVGGGNAGLEAVVDLFPYASKVYLLEYSDGLKGDTVTQERVKNSEKVHIIFNAETKEVKGEKFVTGLAYKDRVSGEEKTLSVGGIFVEIGSVPNSEFVKDLVELNKAGEILIDHKTAATSCEGIWAAGDVTDEMYKQNNISAGDGVKAALSAYSYLNKK